MRKTLSALFLLLSLSVIGTAQTIDNYRTHRFESLEEALKVHPDSVYILYLTQPKTFPKEVYKFRNLRDLTIYMSEIKTVPSDICKLQNLENLSFSHCGNIKKIPKNIGCLKNLTHLDFNLTGVTEVPETIGQLKNLESLNLGFCRVKSFPESFFTLKNLKTVTVGSSEMRDPVLTEKDKEELRKRMPQTKFFF